MKTANQMGVQLRGDRNQCTCCGKLFNSTHAFDRHRTGDMSDRRCLNTFEMLSKGMVEGEDLFWRGSVMPVGMHGVTA